MALDFLSQFVPDVGSAPKNTEIVCASVGGNRITSDDAKMMPIVISRKRGPLVIYGKRWYRLLVFKEGIYSRALMQDYTLNNILGHLVVCYTPGINPETGDPLLTPKGEAARIYAFFDSYLEFYQYTQKIKPELRAFYEIIFGEFPQKPHFDMDINISCGRDINVLASALMKDIVVAIQTVLQQYQVTLDIERDLLIYSSHGETKRSYHIVINNKCHDNNEEAHAFYNKVMEHIKATNQYHDIDLYKIIDRGVYGPRQQFRMVGSQKIGSNRPKIFYEQVQLDNYIYQHKFIEDFSGPHAETMKTLAIIYESLCGFTTNCQTLPSMVPPKTYSVTSLQGLANLAEADVRTCLQLLREKMDPCPFNVISINGHMILLKRLAPSYCPICQRTHDNENPYIMVISGKIYWDCRRASVGAGKLLLGYLAMSFDNVVVQDEAETGEFVFGDITISPTSPPPVAETPVPPETSSGIKLPVPSTVVTANIDEVLRRQQQQVVQQKANRREPEDIEKVRSLRTAFDEISWTAGFK